MNLTFRKTQLSDIDATLSVRARTRQNPLTIANLVAYGVTPQSIASEMASGVQEGWVCVHDSNIVGFCTGNTATGEVLVLAVLASYEGNGIGTRLLCKVVERLRALGFSTPWLAASPDSRIRAHGFYRRLGWRPTGHHHENGDEILELPPECPAATLSPMDSMAVCAKFGGNYQATEETYRLGIDSRITARIAERFSDKAVLETCSGGGFTTLALARVARHVVTIEIDAAHQEQARYNLGMADLLGRVTFILGDCMEDSVLAQTGNSDSAFLDPDWALGGLGHVSRFRQSNMRPPADALLHKILSRIPDVALILPPFIELGELADLRSHERQSIFLDGQHALYCLYFGGLAVNHGQTILCV